MTRLQWAAGALVVVLSLVLAVVLFNRFGEGGTRFAVRGYEVLSDQAVRVDFTVTKDRDASVVCTVRARDREGADTGLALVRVGPSADGTVLVSHELPTSRRANTGEVLGCSPAPDAPPTP